MSTEKARPKAPLFSKIILHLCLIALYLPILVMIIQSFLSKNPISQNYEWTTKWYGLVLSDEALIDSLIRSLIVGINASFISTALGASAAIAIEKSNFKYKSLLNQLSLTSLLIPELVFALSLLTWFVLLNIPLSPITVVIAHVTFSLSFVILTVSARLQGLDLSIDDAARDLGASEWHIIGSITLPMLKPALLTGFILSFLLSFDDFLITFFVSGAGGDTLPIKLYAHMKMGISPKLSALATLMLLFSLLLITLFIKLNGFKSLFGEQKK